MDNFSPAQYDRFEAYRRHALPKQAVRKVCRLFTFVAIQKSEYLPRLFNNPLANKFLSL